MSVLEKKRIKDDGQVPKCYAEESYEVIIDRDVFLRVQAEIDRRANINQGWRETSLTVQSMRFPVLSFAGTSAIFSAQDAGRDRRPDLCPDDGKARIRHRIDT